MAEPDRDFTTASRHADRSNSQRYVTFPHSAITAGMIWRAGDLSVAANNFRELTGNMAEVSLTSLEHTKRLIEDAQGARHLDDLLIIQARYFTSLYRTMADQSQRFGSYLSEVPHDVTQASQDLVEATVEAMQDITVVTASGLAATAVLVQGAPEADAL